MDINEYNKYKNDKVKFAGKFFKGVNPKRGKIVKLPLYDHQKIILKEDDHLLIKKSRQVGISQILAFEIAYHLNYTNDCNILVYCATNTMLNDMRDKVIRHFSNIPDNIRVGQTASLRNNFMTEIGASVEFRTGDASTFSRAQTYDIIYAEEVDYINDFENSYQSLAPCISRKGRMIITTTPNGTQSTFSRLWNSKNMFNKLLVTTNSHSYNSPDEKSLNNLTKKQYDRIINECVII